MKSTENAEEMEQAIITLAPNPANYCFGCGGANDGGMKLTFVQDDEKRRIVGRFVLGERYQGGGGMAHGGIIATLLDEAMGKVCRFREARAVTAELTGGPRQAEELRTLGGHLYAVANDSSGAGGGAFRLGLVGHEPRIGRLSAPGHVQGRF